MSVIPFPITSNHKFQIMNFSVVNDKNLSKTGVSPSYSPIQKIKNHSYNMLKENSYKYVQVFLFDLENFTDPTEENVNKTEIISHDQIQYNFNTSLVRSNNRTLTFKDIFNSSSLSNKLSIQYGEEGLNLGVYAKNVSDALRQSILKIPLDIQLVDEDHPIFYIFEYLFTDLKGNTTLKTGTSATYKFTLHTCCEGKECNNTNCRKKVLRWGTGLEEFVIK